MEINDFSHSSFDDIVFEGRNKGYGAYQLRKLQARDIFFALLFGTFILSAIVFGPLIYSKYFNQKKGPKASVEEVVDLTLANLPPPAKEESVVKPQEPIKVEMEKNVRYEPTDDAKVQDEEPLPDSLLLRTNSGPEHQEGDSGDYIPPSGPIGGGGSGPPDDEIFKYVDEWPYYSGGDFSIFIQENYVMSEKILTKGKPGALFVSFVVEKDGTLSNIVVLNGKGLTAEQDAEALRVIKLSSGKWVPGKINGSPVRTPAKQKFTFDPDQFY